MQDITVQELKERMEKGDRPLLIDVREPHENDEFNIGGHLIPLGNLPGALPQLEPHKDEEIILYCRSGNRSGLAKQMMEKAGFGKVRNLLGGMLAWKEEKGFEI